VSEREGKSVHPGFGRAVDRHPGAGTKPNPEETLIDGSPFLSRQERNEKAGEDYRGFQVDRNFILSGQKVGDAVLEINIL